MAATLTHPGRRAVAARLHPPRQLVLHRFPLEDVAEAPGAARLTAGRAAAVGGKVMPALVMTVAATRFATTGVYEMTGSAGWQAVAGWVGIALAAVALYTALALELEGAQESTVLPVGRRGPGRAAMDGEGPLEPASLAEEAGVRPQL